MYLRSEGRIYILQDGYAETSFVVQLELASLQSDLIARTAHRRQRQGLFDR
jgi:hypothetical protein